ncbi:hypothetical protein [Nocardia lasii]|uniref:Uncharacterized protein n=1 Tax=Nocardia lasii TaxID=1616107 RepID=A0ABW1JQV1_9NOCA
MEHVIPQSGSIWFTPVPLPNGDKKDNLFTIEWGRKSAVVTEDRCTLNLMPPSDVGSGDNRATRFRQEATVTAGDYLDIAVTLLREEWAAEDEVTLDRQPDELVIEENSTLLYAQASDGMDIGV